MSRLLVQLEEPPAVVFTTAYDAHAPATRGKAVPHAGHGRSARFAVRLPTRRPPMPRWNRLALVFLVLACTVGCDQATKQLAITELREGPTRSFLGGVVRLVYAENPGAFLTLFGGLPGPARFWLLTAGIGALLLALAVYLVANRRLGVLPSVALALLAGGGVSNWFDRLSNDGRVVDFMFLGVGPVHTGIFNVADLAIVLGVAVMLLASRGLGVGRVPPDAHG